jgi:2-dehydropantoate 2-reductase
MKIGIVGAGAMGCLIGGYLAEAGEEVWLVARTKSHIEALSKNGLAMTLKGATRTIVVNATRAPAEVGRCDVVIVMTKHHQLRDAVQSASAMIDDETIVVVLQNGIGNVEIVAEFVDDRQILQGVTLLGAVVTGPGAVDVTAIDDTPTFLWPVSGEPSPLMSQFVDAMGAAGFDTWLSPDVVERIWKKLCVNAGISTLTAVLGLKVGDLVGEPAARDLIQSLVMEIAAVAAGEGIALDGEAEFARLMEISRSAAGHFPSILVDVLHGRRTEVGSLSGAVVAKAREQGLDVPRNETIARLLTVIEDTYEKRVVTPNRSDAEGPDDVALARRSAGSGGLPTR